MYTTPSSVEGRRRVSRCALTSARKISDHSKFVSSGTGFIEPGWPAWARSARSFHGNTGQASERSFDRIRSTIHHPFYQTRIMRPEAAREVYRCLIKLLPAGYRDARPPSTSTRSVFDPPQTRSVLDFSFRRLLLKLLDPSKYSWLYDSKLVLLFHSMEV